MIVYSRLGIDDAVSVWQIEQLCFSTPWSLASFESEFSSNSKAKYFGAWEDGKLIAYAGFWHLLDEAHITNIAVHPNLRRQGIGKSMVHLMMREALKLQVSSMTLEVRQSNIAAIKLYEFFGFRSVGARKDYYQKPVEDAIIMWNHDIATTMQHPEISMK